MGDIKMQGFDLRDKSNRKIASIHGTDIRDASNRKVASIHGTDIRDASNRKIASMDDVRKSIDSGMGGASLAALWLFFIR